MARAVHYRRGKPMAGDFGKTHDRRPRGERMRGILRIMVLSSFLSVPVLAAAGAPNDASSDPCGHQAKAECDCAKGKAAKTAKADSAPSEFVRNIWTSP